ncbi:MAG: hypothetical protein OIF58_07040, partial [Cohaesibacter sp.]|nr:hypothetical protein [Cohaesibacter sp.]
LRSRFRDMVFIGIDIRYTPTQWHDAIDAFSIISQPLITVFKVFVPFDSVRNRPGFYILLI